MNQPVRLAILETYYHDYLVDRDTQTFIERARDRYLLGTLERLAQGATSNSLRRAAVLALGHIGGYAENGLLAAALLDDDRGVRMLAENALRSVWCRGATPEHQRRLGDVIRLNTEARFHDAVVHATDLIARAPEFAEAWNQRAIAYYSLRRYLESVHDCRRAIELNPFHFGAIAGLGQCYMHLGNHVWALEHFRRALAMNPDLDGIRANVSLLERQLKREK